MVFDGDFSQLVKTLGKNFFLEMRESPSLLRNGSKKNLLGSFRGVRACYSYRFRVENERNFQLK